MAQKWLANKYENVKKLLKKKINMNCIWAGLTTDVWSSYTGQSYINVTCHFIEESWRRHDVFLSLSPLFEASTAEYFTKKIRSTLKEFDLDEQQIESIIHDQGSNIKKLGKNLPFKSSTCFCIAHLMKNCIKLAFFGFKRRKISPRGHLPLSWKS